MGASDQAKKRIFCVDLLRGLDIFYLVLINYGLLMPAVFRIWPLESKWAKVFWMHELSAFTVPGQEPTGFGLLDFTQALFIFVTGVSASLAFRKFVREDGKVDLRTFWLRLGQRMLMLWTFGSLIRGLLTFKLFTGSPAAPNFVFYSDTLHTIAVAYCAASIALLLSKWRLRFVLGLALVAVAAVIMACFGDYSQHGNAARLFEEYVYGKMGGRAKDFCYLLTTLTWAGMGILASLAGDVIKGSLAPWSKVKVLSVTGLIAIAAGWVMSIWIPPNRFIYTASFVFLTMGLSQVLLATLYAITDIWNFRRGTWLVMLVGQTSLASWMLIHFFGRPLWVAAESFVVGIPKLIGTDAYQQLFTAIVRVILLVILVWIWRRFRRCRC